MVKLAETTKSVMLQKADTKVDVGNTVSYIDLVIPINGGADKAKAAADSLAEKMKKFR